jgi:hypothetical protein
MTDQIIKGFVQPGVTGFRVTIEIQLDHGIYRGEITLTDETFQQLVLARAGGSNPVEALVDMLQKALQTAAPIPTAQDFGALAEVEALKRQRRARIAEVIRQVTGWSHLSTDQHEVLTVDQANEIRERLDLEAPRYNAPTTVGDLIDFFMYRQSSPSATIR